MRRGDASYSDRITGRETYPVADKGDYYDISDGLPQVAHS